MKLLIVACVLALCGCARMSANLQDISTTTSTNATSTTRTITTKLKGSAWFTSKQNLANFKALQTDKSQTVGGTGLNQTGATNVVEALKAIDSILSKIRPTP